MRWRRRARRSSQRGTDDRLLSSVKQRVSATVDRGEKAGQIGGGKSEGRDGCGGGAGPEEVANVGQMIAFCRLSSSVFQQLLTGAKKQVRGLYSRQNCRQHCPPPSCAT